MGVTRPLTVGIVADVKATLEGRVQVLKGKKVRPRDGKDLAGYRQAAQTWWDAQFQMLKSWKGPGIHPAQAVKAVGKGGRMRRTGWIAICGSRWVRDLPWPTGGALLNALTGSLPSEPARERSWAKVSFGLPRRVCGGPQGEFFQPLLCLCLGYVLEVQVSPQCRDFDDVLPAPATVASSHPNVTVLIPWQLWQLELIETREDSLLRGQEPELNAVAAAVCKQGIDEAQRFGCRVHRPDRVSMFVAPTVLTFRDSMKSTTSFSAYRTALVNLM
jgi:hypothetical protein